MNNLRIALYLEATFQLSWIQREGEPDTPRTRALFFRHNLRGLTDSDKGFTATNLVFGMAFADLEKETDRSSLIPAEWRAALSGGKPLSIP
jgi:hypothetical protein